MKTDVKIWFEGYCAAWPQGRKVTSWLLLPRGCRFALDDAGNRWPHS